MLRGNMFQFFRVMFTVHSASVYQTFIRLALPFLASYSSAYGWGFILIRVAVDHNESTGTEWDAITRQEADIHLGWILSLLLTMGPCTYIHTTITPRGNLEQQNSLYAYLFLRMKKPEKMEKTHTYIGRTCKIDRNPLLGFQNDAISIGVYIYDSEICNPLGTSRKVHKITAVYWVLLNLPAWEQL